MDNNSCGTFSTFVISDPDEGSSQIYDLTANIDIDGDGDSDLVVADLYAGVFYWENIDGTFGSEPASILSGFSGVEQIVAGDLDGDGNVNDVAFLDSLRSILYIARNTGGGAFAITELQQNTRQDSLSIGDLNNDGASDILVSSASRVEVMQYLQTGGEFGDQSTATSGDTGVHASALVDLDGDDCLDVVMLAGSRFIQWAANDCAGNFGSPQTLVAGLNFNIDFLTFADLNGDGNQDLIVSTFNGVRWCAGNGDGTVSSSCATVGPSSQVIRLTVADMNGDGKLDLVIPYFVPINQVQVFINQGDGVFDSDPCFSSAAGDIVAPYAAGVADFNNDGQMDIVSASSFDGTIKVFLRV